MPDRHPSRKNFLYLPCGPPAPPVDNPPPLLVDTPTTPPVDPPPALRVDTPPAPPVDTPPDPLPNSVEYWYTILHPLLTSPPTPRQIVRQTGAAGTPPGSDTVHTLFPMELETGGENAAGGDAGHVNCEDGAETGLEVQTGVEVETGGATAAGGDAGFVKLRWVKPWVLTDPDHVLAQDEGHPAPRYTTPDAAGDSAGYVNLTWLKPSTPTDPYRDLPKSPVLQCITIEERYHTKLHSQFKWRANKRAAELAARQAAGTQGHDEGTQTVDSDDTIYDRDSYQ
ncbi:hypothetical protein EDC01DRAFT_781407 [Geopyxis carbonaria]|nr:hypothetical protein EDC01DRAFT_781407 [Geopyxis carbonaria]